MATLIPKSSFLGKTAKVLGHPIIDTKFFIFDLWMIIHLFVGFLLALIIKDRQLFGVQLQDWMIVLVILILYEIFEVLFRGILFEQERFVNIGWDIIIGMIGFFIGKLAFK